MTIKKKVSNSGDKIFGSCFVIKSLLVVKPWPKTLSPNLKRKTKKRGLGLTIKSYGPKKVKLTQNDSERKDMESNPTCSVVAPL